MVHTIQSEADGEVLGPSQNPQAAEEHASSRWRCLITERDQAVMVLIAQGLSNKEIASRLGISLQTVKIHVSNMLKRLELADRTQLVVYALTHLPE
jgi:DNA-binding NarL/FixJ family response regulator